MTIVNSNILRINKAKQVAFAVHDLQKAMDRMWTIFGIGPWKVNIRDYNSTKDNSIISDMVYMKKPGCFSYQVASAVFESGLMFELIQPLSGENIFSDFLKEHGEGMHHIGWHIVYSQEEFDRVTSMLEGQGFPCLQSARVYASQMAYFDTTRVLNTFLEVAYEDPSKKRPDPFYIYPTP